MYALEISTMKKPQSDLPSLSLITFFLKRINRPQTIKNGRKTQNPTNPNTFVKICERKAKGVLSENKMTSDKRIITIPRIILIELALILLFLSIILIIYYLEYKIKH